MPQKHDDDYWSVLRMLEWATEYFKKKHVPDPRHSIEWLLADVLGCKRLDLYLQYERPLSPDELDRIRPLVKRRADHEPLQYITGSTNFMGCHIEVNPSVLIPRIETEQLVELLLESTSDLEHSPVTLLDIGSGSGCIPIAIKKFRPAWTCHGIDISGDALSLSEKNAAANDVDIQFDKGDLFNLDQVSKPSRGWDIIISNPPYIGPEEKPSLEKQVTDYEPGLALFHDNPLDVYRPILSYAQQENASLFLELNDQLADQILKLSTGYFPAAKLKADLDKNPRFLLAGLTT
ncbi:peptide chain release factor N(5)-glutamine methyltransferase [Rhodohalobacter sp. 8-1]|uniref:peptide chain release factor N(5)-glutamine methyltransferase n=1 Tax=Rhodohalobacter sp. 8-1 TaxID=3131972 RepID=UPI0030EC2346